MKKHQILKIHPKYAFLALCSLLFATGCVKEKEQRHTNVITGIIKSGKEKAFLLWDVDTDQERIFTVDRQYTKKQILEDINYFELDDTLVLVTGGGFTRHNNYQNNMILRQGFYGIEYNTDSIYARKLRTQFNALKQEMQNTKSR
jgi:hypothetical protein